VSGWPVPRVTVGHGGRRHVQVSTETEKSLTRRPGTRRDSETVRGTVPLPPPQRRHDNVCSAAASRHGPGSPAQAVRASGCQCPGQRPTVTTEDITEARLNRDRDPGSPGAGVAGKSDRSILERENSWLVTFKLHRVPRITLLNYIEILAPPKN
jgi:hypothetical protein